jgi:hypothetical protein
MIIQDFTDHSPDCIEFRLSSDFKTRKLGANFNFLDRESSFIFSEKYCEPFRIFISGRAANSVDRFFLHHLPSARFGDQILLSQAKPIGPKPLSQAVKKEISTLVYEGLIAPGNCSNTSLRKGLSDALSLAYVPPVIVDLAVGHFSSKSGQTSSAFTSTPNLTSYLSLWKQSITRGKIALLLFDPSLKWQDICDEDAFHTVYKKLFPNSFLPSAASSAGQDRRDTRPLLVPPVVELTTPAPCIDLTDSDLLCFENEVLNPFPIQPLQSQPTSNFDYESYPDDLFLSFLTPPELRRNPQPAPHQSFAQRNTAVQNSTTMAPVIHVHGGTVNFNFWAGPDSNF